MTNVPTRLKFKDTFKYPYPPVVDDLNEETKNRGFVKYPKYMYHAAHKPVLVNDAEEESFLDKKEWKDSPEEFGVITAPSQGQIQKQEIGFDFEELKRKKKAEREERRIRRLAEEDAAAEAERRKDDEYKPQGQRILEQALAEKKEAEAPLTGEEVQEEDTEEESASQRRKNRRNRKG